MVCDTPSRPSKRLACLHQKGIDWISQLDLWSTTVGGRSAPVSGVLAALPACWAVIVRRCRTDCMQAGHLSCMANMLAYRVDLACPASDDERQSRVRGAYPPKRLQAVGPNVELIDPTRVYRDGAHGTAWHVQLQQGVMRHASSE